MIAVTLGDMETQRKRIEQRQTERDNWKLEHWDDFNRITSYNVCYTKLLRVYFKDTGYFAVSALGSNPIDQKLQNVVQPIRVDEPFIWLLYKLNYIEGRE